VRELFTLGIMPEKQTPRFARMLPGQRRRSFTLAYLNGALWGIGNGLSGTTLVFYLAQSYGASGLALSWVLAAPALVGVLRLFTPLWMDRLGNRRRFCIRMFSLSAVAMLGLPLMSAPEILPEDAHSITALIICWAGYQLLTDIGMVALWSWFSDLVPSRIRGRFVGRRSSWRNIGRVIGTVFSATGNYYWQRYCVETNQPDQYWIGYATLATAGSVAMLLAVWPLTKMDELPSPSEIGSRSARYRMRELIQPFMDKSFRSLMYYGGWFSFANGLTDTAIRIFILADLQIDYSQKRILDSTSRGIQATLMPWAGNQADQRGNIPLLVTSQGLVAVALLFLLPATAEAKWWVLGTYTLWIAYAGINVAMPNLMLQMSKPECSAAYAAAWFAVVRLFYAISALIGGVLYDWASEDWTYFSVGTWQCDHFAMLIIIGFMLRSLGMVWAARIHEPT